MSAGTLAVLPLSTTPAVTFVALAAGGVGAAVVWRAPRPWTGIKLAGAALVAVGVVSAVALVGLVFAGLRSFGVIHLAYLVLVVSVPMVGVALTARALGGGSPSVPGALAALVLVVPAAVGGYATHVEPYRLRVDRATVRLDPDRAGDDTVRIGVLADLQTNDVGAYEHEAVERLLAEEPDLILLPGDLFQGSDQQFDAEVDELRALLGQLRAPHGVYFVRGDVDHGDRADRALAGTGVVILDDEAVVVTVGDRRLRIGGNRLSYQTAGAVELRRSLAADEPGAADDGAIRILVAHRPDVVLDLAPASRLDLTVAGHTHGGQVVLPGFGPPITLSGVPRHVARGGLHEIDGNPIYVSTGVGLERAQAPQIRLFSRPSVGLLELR